MSDVAKIIIYRGLNSTDLLGLWCADRGANDGNFGIKFDDIVVYGALVDLYNLIILIRILMSVRIGGKVVNDLGEFLDKEDLLPCAINVKILAQNNIAIDTVVLDQGMSSESFVKIVNPYLNMTLDDLLCELEEVFLTCHPNTKPLLASINHKLMVMEEWLDHDKKSIEGGRNIGEVQ